MVGSQWRNRTGGSVVTWVRRLGLGLAILLSQSSIAAGGTADADAAATEPMFVEAVWKPQQIDLYFHSSTIFYPCDSLNDKVRRLLLQLGVSGNVSVRSTGCQMSNQFPRSPLVRIRLSSPVEATPQVLAELSKTRSTRELIARVRGGQAVSSGIDAQFPAQWKRVSLARGARFRLDSGDCELVDAFKRQVMPQLAIRIVQDAMRCSLQPYAGQVRLEVEALTAVEPGVPTAAALAPDVKRTDVKAMLAGPGET